MVKSTVVKKATKPGIKTTEFWITLLMPVLAVVVLKVTGVEISPEIQNGVLTAFGISGGAYTMSRSHTKANDETPNA